MKIPSLINMRLILHHWDTDGICSAALLYNEESKNMTPIIGNYFLTDDEIERISQFDEIYIADLALHEDSLKKLVEVARVKVFDHHLTKKIDGVEYINPIMNGKEEEEYPSASWIVGEFLEKENKFDEFINDLENRYVINFKNEIFPFLDGSSLFVVFKKEQNKNVFSQIFDCFFLLRYGLI